MDGNEARVLLSKPERIFGFDGGLVERLAGTVGSGRAALVEVAGRDSLAAAATVARAGSYETLIPTIVYTGTEFGDWETFLGNARAVEEFAGEDRGVRVTETVVLGSPLWWHASAGRLSGELSREYGFSTTCLACHMYFHAARVPLARAVGAGAVVGGERLRHDGRLKLNQLEPAIAAYREALAASGVELDLPVLKSDAGQRIEEILGPAHSDPTRQMNCVLEGNYLDTSGALEALVPGLERYLEEFLVPFTRRVLEAFEAGKHSPGYAGIAAAVFNERRSA